jgi:glycosyltransferase involved in cell wall biosynthesis
MYSENMFQRHGARCDVLHLTTAHPPTSSRILYRECISLGQVPGRNVALAAPGAIPDTPFVRGYSLPPVPDSRAGRAVSCLPRAWRAYRAIQPQVLHLHDPELLPLGVYLAGQGQAVVWDAHEDYPLQFEDPASRRPRWQVRIAAKPTLHLLKSMDQRASAVVAATHPVAAWYNNPRTVVVGNEPRLSDYESIIPDKDARRVLYTGRTNSHHLFREVVDAISAFDDVTLVVAGNIVDDALWRYAQEKLGNKLEYHGWLTPTEVAEIMETCSLGLATYEDRRTYADANPTKIWEFAAAGLPCVSTDNHGLAADVASHNLGLLTGGDAHAIRDAIRDGLGDTERWQQWSSAGKSYAHVDGGWKRSEGALLDLYVDLLQEADSVVDTRP